MIAKGLENAKSLRILDLSYNPLTAEGAIVLVDKLRNNSVKLTDLLMDNVEVNKEFVRVSISFFILTKGRQRVPGNLILRHSVPFPTSR